MVQACGNPALLVSQSGRPLCTHQNFARHACLALKSLRACYDALSLVFLLVSTCPSGAGLHGSTARSLVLRRELAREARGPEGWAWLAADLSVARLSFPV